MALRLRVITDLPEDLGPVPSTHTRQFTTNCNSSFRGSNAPLASTGTCIHMAPMTSQRHGNKHAFLTEAYLHNLD